ncbi:MAG: hypothetical protein FJW20_22900 [Acidimicrobiia bacterium]|nr:hypothetical protein [Acidimicrobiia bacterium]
MRHHSHRAAIVLAALLLASPLTAQSGHWKGSIQTPNGELDVEIDLAQDGDKGWIGSLSIPSQNAKGLGLLNVAVKEGSISFALKAPGQPRFQGTIDKEGGKMTGQFIQSGTEMTFQLTRTGEAKVEKPVRNAALSKELEGTWEGTLDTPQGSLRLRVVLSNEAGAGTGSLFSVDQGNTELPIARITQKDAAVILEVPLIDGGFRGELKGNEMAGEWSQRGNSLPLQLTKVVK